MQGSSLRMVYVAAYTWFTWCVMIFGMSHAINKVAYRIRIQYFEKAIEKDAAYYDLNNESVSFKAKDKRVKSIIYF